MQVENFLNNRVKTPLNQQQYDALVSFILDKGYRCLQVTGILNDINNGDYDSVPDKIINCDEVGNKRRIVEAKMFYGKRQWDTERRTWLIWKVTVSSLQKKSFEIASSLLLY